MKPRKARRRSGEGRGWTGTRGECGARGSSCFGEGRVELQPAAIREGLEARRKLGQGLEEARRRSRQVKALGARPLMDQGAAARRRDGARRTGARGNAAEGSRREGSRREGSSVEKGWTSSGQGKAHDRTTFDSELPRSWARDDVCPVLGSYSLRYPP